jgi:hypothetical protein
MRRMVRIPRFTPHESAIRFASSGMLQNGSASNVVRMHSATSDRNLLSPFISALAFNVVTESY